MTPSRNIVFYMVGILCNFVVKSCVLARDADCKYDVLLILYQLLRNSIS